MNYHAIYSAVSVIVTSSAFAAGSFGVYWYMSTPHVGRAVIIGAFLGLWILYSRRCLIKAHNDGHQHSVDQLASYLIQKGNTVHPPESPAGPFDIRRYP